MSIYEWLPHVAITLLTIIYSYGQRRIESISGTLPRTYAQVSEAEDVGEVEEPSVEDNDQEPRLTTPEQIKAYITEAFSPLGGEALSWGLRVAFCESSYRQYDATGAVLENWCGCIGVFQYKRSTFELYCTGDIASARDQIDCAADMWQKGLQHHWECK